MTTICINLAPMAPDELHELKTLLTRHNIRRDDRKAGRDDVNDAAVAAILDYSEIMEGLIRTRLTIPTYMMTPRMVQVMLEELGDNANGATLRTDLRGVADMLG